VQIVSSEFEHSNFAGTYFEWFSPSGMTSNPYPSDGDTNILRNITLGWTTGNGTSSIDDYSGPQNLSSHITNTLFE